MIIWSATRRASATTSWRATWSWSRWWPFVSHRFDRGGQNRLANLVSSWWNIPVTNSKSTHTSVCITHSVMHTDMDANLKIIAIRTCAPFRKFREKHEDHWNCWNPDMFESWCSGNLGNRCRDMETFAIAKSLNSGVFEILLYWILEILDVSKYGKSKNL